MTNALPEHDRVLARHRVTLTFDISVHDISQPVADAAYASTSNYHEFRNDNEFLHCAAAQRALLHAVLADPDTHAALTMLLARQPFLYNSDAIAGVSAFTHEAEEEQLLLRAAAQMPDGARQALLDGQGFLNESTTLINEATSSFSNLNLTVTALPT
ncbi:hypothetical protein [Deinococcus soli (ex Cha et al. 2016)]|uniref:O-linked N-acetylglucosamine transferase (SPINDLY family) n=2 Tax=Deinococcus soli (ex Cha et al. 2016) TaxID=1309411 RepID=A0ACC6KHP2_9DEIO|nr:hypothetical protein [Deinococcus soli (ex Cha et al. 2016)]MDR6218758.1 putative O-linked N-acetylglucosamine transferase (SPINDLY family) [Deinococcus soli (ex Cha et al. 2016)]MDR6328555.1 putative O-linked N-acetylglucosamine transferase (SPINDLY family) [Deinococcus soli (ex Cha et al. 2016)]MDR6751958.1 putative O-linked N-acetylglucosamine transferase (SPINDLY family) [Deinococcus soli (ex Cha et al. 2016)]